MRSVALVFVAILATASGAHASILAASSQAVPAVSATAASEWNVATLQHELNASLSEAAEARIPAGMLSSPVRTPLDRGGTLISRTPAGPTASLGDGAAIGGLFELPDDLLNRGNLAGGGDPWLGRGRDRDRGSPYATPEPSTWVLFASGLLLLAGWAATRRRLGAVTR